MSHQNGFGRQNHRNELLSSRRLGEGSCAKIGHCMKLALAARPSCITPDHIKSQILHRNVSHMFCSISHLAGPCVIAYILPSAALTFWWKMKCVPMLILMLLVSSQVITFGALLSQYFFNVSCSFSHSLNQSTKSGLSTLEGSRV